MKTISSLNLQQILLIFFLLQATSTSASFCNKNVINRLIQRTKFVANLKSTSGVKRIGNTNFFLYKNLYVIDADPKAPSIYLPTGYSKENMSSDHPFTLQIDSIDQKLGENGYLRFYVYQPSWEKHFRIDLDFNEPSHGQFAGTLDKPEANNLESQLMSYGFKMLYLDSATNEKYYFLEKHSPYKFLIKIASDGRMLQIFRTLDQDKYFFFDYSSRLIDIVPDNIFGLSLIIKSGIIEFGIYPVGGSHIYKVRNKFAHEGITDLNQISLSDINPPRIPITEPEGFIRGGVNSSDTIKRTTSLNGKEISFLQQNMYPNENSGPAYDTTSETGFLLPGTTLHKPLIKDNNYVLGKHLTHQTVATPLLIISILVDELFFKEGSRFTFNGDTFTVINITTHSGNQASPFFDGITSRTIITIRKERTGEVLTYSTLLGEMIYWWGFYEGEGVPYRLDSAQPIAFFNLK